MLKASQQSRKDQGKKKALKATWDKSSLSESPDKEELCQVTKNMAFMAIDDGESSDEEIQPKESSSSEEELLQVKKDYHQAMMMK